MQLFKTLLAASQILVLSLSVAHTAMGQTCDGDVMLSSQSEVDDFQCQVIVGDLVISGNDIVDLAPLSTLHKVTGNVHIRANSNLRTLAGLHGLDSVGQLLMIEGNEQLGSTEDVRSLQVVGELVVSGNLVLRTIDFPALKSVGRLSITGNQSVQQLDGFSSLQTAGPLEITSNTGLASISGFNAMQKIQRNQFRMPAFITINGNPMLKELTGFQALTDAGDFTISDNRRLPEIKGFGSLQYVYGTLSIQYNPELISITGFQKLRRINTVSKAVTRVGLDLANNASLRDLSGFLALEGIGDDYDGFLYITNNASLKDLNGLASLKSIVGQIGTAALVIINNASLENLDGLSSLTMMSALQGTTVRIMQNPMLSNGCGIRPLLKNIMTPQSTDAINISENGGCTLESIIACGPQEVVRFTLVDTRNGQRLGMLNGDSTTIDIANDSYTFAGVQASTFPEPAGSVAFMLEHKFKATDNSSPYIFDLMKYASIGKHQLISNVYTGANRQGTKGIGRTALVRIVNSTAVISIDIRDTDGNPYGSLIDGMEIPSDQLSRMVLGINTNSNRVSSVRYFLNNRFTGKDNAAPFTLDGLDVLCNSHHGYYTLKAIPYVRVNSRELPGKPLEVRFKVVPPDISIAGFMIIDPHGRFLKNINEGDVVDAREMERTGSTIVANARGRVGSVKFDLNGSFVRIENFAPYTLTGDDGKYFNPWNPKPAQYTLRATPYREPGGLGMPGTSLVIHFTVADRVIACARQPGDAATNEGQVQRTGLTLYPVPAERQLFVYTSFETDTHTRLTILTIQGTKILNKNFDPGTELDVSMLQPGVYFIEVVTCNGSRYLERFTKQ